MNLDAVAAEAVAGIRLLPVVHDRLELAAVARAVLEAFQPEAVAVELPTTLAAAAELAVARLPRVSVVISEQAGEPALVWVVAPGDPLAEALRWARERGRPRFYVDPDLPYAERHADPVPDPIWNEADKQFDEAELATLILAIAQINVWNRLNVAVRQPAGVWKG